MLPKLNSGSFRDPAGHIYENDNSIYRSISQHGKKAFEEIHQTNIINDAIKEKFIVATKILSEDKIPENLKNSAYVLEHNKLPYISYPYEWSFYQLKDAALHHLDFQIYLFEKGFTLKDASAYNMQFIGARPIFIDILSIKKYSAGEFWTSHKQFCENFLNPLLLKSLLDLNHNSWFRGALDGIPTADLAKLIPFRKKLSWNIFSQVILHARFDRLAVKNQEKPSIKNKKTQSLPKLAYIGLLKQMRNWIAKLKPLNKEKTLWADYTNTNTYSSEETKAKFDLLAEFIQATKPNKLLDLGCNNGEFSFAAIKNGAQSVVGFDFDQSSIADAYLKAKKHQAPFLPLYLDAANPSPNQGWIQQERKGFNERTKACALIALAFIHHLAIAKNTPLEQTIDWIISLAPTGLIEFIPKNDPTICKMLRLRQDIFIDYNIENFENILKSKAKIIKKTQITKNGRVVFWFKKTV